MVTGDGSRTLYSPQFDQTYHSTFGALTESEHVFIDCAKLKQRLNEQQRVRILEIGFGTGLNFLLSVREASNSNSFIEYVALENCVIPENILRELKYEHIEGCDHNWMSLLHFLSCTNRDTLKGTHFWLRIINSLENIVSSASANFDLIYLDAFSPNANPELWTRDFLTALYASLSINGVLTTYCAKGSVRRTLEAAGFEVKRMKGPPGKREILRAKKRQD